MLRDRAAVGELVEVLAGRDAAINARDVEAAERVRRLHCGLRRCLCTLLTEHGASRRADEHREGGAGAQCHDTPKPLRFHGCKLLTEFFFDCSGGYLEYRNDSSRN